MDSATEEHLRMDAHGLRRECSVSGCTRTVRSGKAHLCEGHYYQQRRGKPFTPLRERNIKSTTCAIDGCNKPRKGKYCAMHAARIRRHGDPDVMIPHDSRNLPKGSAHHKWLDDPDYRQWHQRLRQQKGSASLHRCSFGCGNQAQSWAYVGSRDESDRGIYETDPDFYAPACFRCHRNFDRRFNGAVPQPKLRGADWLEEAMMLYEEGYGSTKIGRIVGRNPATVYRMLKKNGVQMREQSGGIKTSESSRPSYKEK